MKNKIYGPFELKENINEAEKLLADSHSIMFLEDPKGNDWYELQKQLASETLKITFDQIGLINSASYDASTLWPQSFFLAEVNVVPEKFESRSNSGKWIFDGEKITERIFTSEELIEHAVIKRNLLMTAANEIITPLQDAVDIDDASDEEITLLKAWKTYRVALNRLDLSIAPDITWPEIPA
jgi:hypothetical protein